MKPRKRSPQLARLLYLAAIAAGLSPQQARDNDRRCRLGKARR